MIQLVFYVIFLILLFSIMGKIIYDYIKGGKLKYKAYGIPFVSCLIINKSLRRKKKNGKTNGSYIFSLKF